MKRLKLLCISAALATTLFSSTVFAEGVQSIPNSLDIDTVINMAIDNSYSIKKIDIGIKQAENSYNDALTNGASYSSLVSKAEGDAKLNLIKARDFNALFRIITSRQGPVRGG